MKASLIRNQFGELGFFYGEDLGFTPEWASIDAERGELSVFGGDDDMQLIMIEGMTEEIYQQIIEKDKILLVQIQDNLITKPIKAEWVSLMVSHQI
tara:strand:+ start:380 stop:667 length:288 start_codon:yes stop_codon:yes gene_type:complete